MTALYRLAWIIGGPLYKFLYRLHFPGRELLPDGPCIVCANHSSMKDPILLAIAIGPREQPCFMAKAELFAKPLVGALLRGLGAFPVRRGEADVTAVKTSMQYLKSGRKLCIFPEGTRLTADDAASAKTGAVSLAARLHVPLVPVWIPREKRLFRRTVVRVGAPYCVEGARRADLTPLAEELMERIYALGREDEACR